MSEVFFGGPDRPPRSLRDLLEARVAAVPSGGAIHWATYYFRDRALARALIAASDRGVRVTLHVEGRPRRAGVNAEVLAMLSAHGLSGGLHIHRPAAERLAPLHPHLHTKIYAFSHPEPAVLVGSFNPSGDEPEDAEIIAEIGDQDRGHNMLVDYRDPAVVRALARHVDTLGGLADRFRSRRSVEGADGTRFWFYPRLDTGIIDRALAGLGEGATIRGAISHLKRGFLAERLAAAARAGASVRLIVHDTERRVPEAAVATLAGAGVAIERYARPDSLPLHAKFLLVETPAERSAWFGSFNYNPRSRYLNHELLVRSRDPQLFAALAARFEAIAAEMA